MIDNYVFTSKQSEKIVSNYLKNHNFIPKRFNTKNLSMGIKSPDFQVYKNEKLSFYCEVKNPLHLANEITNMFHFTTSISKIRRFIHRAVQQFKDIDNNHKHSWIIIFTSAHFQLNWTNFSDAYLGYMARNGKMICDLRQEKYVINHNNDVSEIDAYIWCQVNSNDEKIYQYVPFVTYDSPLRVETKDIINKLTPYTTEKIMNMNSKTYNNPPVKFNLK